MYVDLDQKRTISNIMISLRYRETHCPNSDCAIIQIDVAIGVWKIRKGHFLFCDPP